MLYSEHSMYQPKSSRLPLLRSLHWLPVAARTEYKTLMLAYKALKGMAPSCLQSLTTLGC